MNPCTRCAQFEVALNESAEMIKMLMILGAGCKDHPGYRGRAKPHKKCPACDIIFDTAQNVRAVLTERAAAIKDRAEQRIMTPATSLVDAAGNPVKA